MAALATAMASNADSALVEHTSLGRSPILEAMRNPALHGMGYRTSFSQLAVGIDMQRQSQAFVPEKGKGYTLPYLTVRTHLNLNDRTTVWGSASYTTGKQHGITWNSTADYDILQPYILADTLGGDTHRERYAINGGYARRINQRISLGGEMMVRAEQEYRDRDPRMRGIVTDLTLRLGMACNWNSYRMGAALEANIYKQTNSVAFYHEEGVIPEYQMTGLGTEYSRFSGDKRSLYYDGGGMALLLHASPSGGNGLYGDISLDEHRYHRKLAEYNSMPLTDLYHEHVGATVGWRHKTASQRQITVLGHIDYTRHTGNEHVGGTSDARYFPVIACLTMYKGHTLDSHLGMVYSRGRWNMDVQAGYLRTSEEYVYPNRQDEASHAYGKVKGQCFITPRQGLILTLQAHAAQYFNTSERLSIPLANMAPHFIEMVQHKHHFATANYTDLAAAMRADLAWKKSRYGLFAEVGSQITLCSVGEQAVMLQASIGITF